MSTATCAGHTHTRPVFAAAHGHPQHGSAPPLCVRSRSPEARRTEREVLALRCVSSPRCLRLQTSPVEACSTTTAGALLQTPVPSLHSRNRRLHIARPQPVSMTVRSVPTCIAHLCPPSPTHTFARSPGACVHCFASLSRVCAPLHHVPPTLLHPHPPLYTRTHSRTRST